MLHAVWSSLRPAADSPDQICTFFFLKLRTSISATAWDKGNKKASKARKSCTSCGDRQNISIENTQKKIELAERTEHAEVKPELVQGGKNRLSMIEMEISGHVANRRKPVHRHEATSSCDTDVGSDRLRGRYPIYALNLTRVPPATTKVQQNIRRLLQTERCLFWKTAASILAWNGAPGVEKRCFHPRNRMSSSAFLSGVVEGRFVCPLARSIIRTRTDRQNVLIPKVFTEDHGLWSKEVVCSQGI